MNIMEYERCLSDISEEEQCESVIFETVDEIEIFMSEHLFYDVNEQRVLEQIPYHVLDKIFSQYVEPLDNSKITDKEIPLDLIDYKCIANIYTFDKGVSEKCIKTIKNKCLMWLHNNNRIYIDDKVFVVKNNELINRKYNSF